MDSKILVIAPDIDLGKQAAQALLDDEELRVVAIFWWYDDASEEYRFTVASRYYSKKGPRAAYLRIRKVLKDVDLLEKLRLDDVWAVPHDHWTVKALQTVGKLSEGTRLTRCFVNKVFIQDAYIYLLKARRR